SGLTPDHRLSPPCASRTKSSRSFIFGSFLPCCRPGVWSGLRPAGSGEGGVGVPERGLQVGGRAQVFSGAEDADERVIEGAAVVVGEGPAGRLAGGAFVS